MSGHGQYVCQFGIVHMQCRCISNEGIHRIQCDTPEEHSTMAPEVPQEEQQEERPTWPPKQETKEDPISDFVNDPLREEIAKRLSEEVGTRMIWGRVSVGSDVHYVSYGTPGGEYSSTCRAAKVTQVGDWMTAHTLNGVWGNDATVDAETGEDGIRTLLQSFDKTACHLHVANPTGQFFNLCKWDQDEKRGGTWHWPDQECIDG